MHQWWGDNVSYSDHRYTFFKEGQATTAEYYYAARAAAVAAGGVGTTAGDAAYEASIVNSFNANYNTRSNTFWTIAPSNPTSATLFGTSNTYTRPGIAYIALRAVLGTTLYNAALQHIQQAYGGGSISEAQLKSEFHKYFAMDADPACHAKLDEFFREWWDTAYPSGGGVNRPRITGPGLAGDGFYDADGGCSDPAIGVTTPGATVPAILSLSLGTPAAFGPFTPGMAKDYTAAMTANVISSAGDGTLSVADPSSTAPGHLVNGAFSLPTALKAVASSPASTSAGAGSVSGSPLNLASWSNPISNDPVTVTFTQSIGSTDALRTGSYAKTLTFTLSTTTP
jgi:hypothetical protein